MNLLNGTSSTAGDCIVKRDAEYMTIIAEFGRMPEPELNVRAGWIYQFDKRWLVRSTKNGVVRRLGPAGWARRSQFFGYYPISDWTARMGAMIPVLHGLDGRLYWPHLKREKIFEPDQATIAAFQGLTQPSAFCATSVPVDGPCAVIKTDELQIEAKTRE